MPDNVIDFTPRERPLAYRASRVHEVAPWSRSYTFELIATGQLKAKKLGRATFVLADDLDAFLAGLPDAAGAGGADVA